MSDFVTADPERCGGRPTVAGTRFTVAQLLAELAGGLAADEAARDFDLDPAAVRGCLAELAAMFDRPGGPHAEARAEEREACAAMADAEAAECESLSCVEEAALAREIARAIRGRAEP